MKLRRFLGLAILAAAIVPGSAEASNGYVAGYELDTTVCAPNPVNDLCVSVPDDTAGYRDARCRAHVSGYQVGDPTTTITMYAYVYSSGSTYAEIRCEARHDGVSVFSVAAMANGPSATAQGVGTISTAALPSSLYCVAIDDWVAWLC